MDEARLFILKEIFLRRKGCWSEWRSCGPAHENTLLLFSES
jgi:hypothetical protein